MSTLTNLDKIKEITKKIAYIPVVECDIIPTFAMHPFISDMFWYEKAIKENSLDKLSDYSFNSEDLFLEWCTEFGKKVDHLTNIDKVYWLWLKPYKMAFIKYCGQYLSKEDFSRLLAESWIMQENPNTDINVTRKEIISMFKKADKKNLMTEDELNFYTNLSDEVTVYRGINKGIDLGLSWTINKDTAIWFKDRFGEEKDARLLKAVVPKKYILAYFNSRKEHEIILDVFAIKNLIEKC